MRRAIPVLCCISLALFISGCGASARVEKAAPRKPELVLNVASLNLSSYNKRIERSELVRLAALLKKEEVDILGVQGLTRYPGVATRTDFVDVLATLTSMRSAFGASSDLSGRQQGHAIFSVYPVRTHENIPFDNVGDELESALLLVVDAGVRDIQVANMRLPRNSTAANEEQCLQAVMKRSAGELPLLLLIGNPRGLSGQSEKKSGDSGVRVHGGEALEVLSVRPAQSNFGSMTITKVGIFRQ